MRAELRRPGLSAGGAGMVMFFSMGRGDGTDAWVTGAADAGLAADLIIATLAPLSTGVGLMVLAAGASVLGLTAGFTASILAAALTGALTAGLGAALGTALGAVFAADFITALTGALAGVLTCVLTGALATAFTSGFEPDFLAAGLAVSLGLVETTALLDAFGAAAGLAAAFLAGSAVLVLVTDLEAGLPVFLV